MHQKKGVLELVESWGRVKPKGWACELVYTLNGEEEKSYETKVKQRVLDLGMSYVDASHPTPYTLLPVILTWRT